MYVWKIFNTDSFGKLIINEDHLDVIKVFALVPEIQNMRDTLHWNLERLKDFQIGPTVYEGLNQDQEYYIPVLQ